MLRRPFNQSVNKNTVATQPCELWGKDTTCHVVPGREREFVPVENAKATPRVPTDDAKTRVKGRTKDGGMWSTLREAATKKRPDVPNRFSTETEAFLEEARNTLFFPSQEKFHTFVFRGLRNISEAP
jgi:hypothetical protein